MSEVNDEREPESQSPWRFARWDRRAVNRVRVTCPDCGTVTFPADAGYVDYDLLLVTWVPACAHVKEETVLLDLRLVPERNPEAERPLCQSSGGQCVNRVRQGSLFCAKHQPGPVAKSPAAADPDLCHGWARGRKRPCRLPPEPGSDYCTHHQPRSADEKAEK